MRADHFPSALSLRDVLNQIRTARRILPVVRPQPCIALAGTGPNRNPYVSHLSTLYSQSRRSTTQARVVWTNSASSRMSIPRWIARIRVF